MLHKRALRVRVGRNVPGGGDEILGGLVHAAVASAASRVVRRRRRLFPAVDARRDNVDNLVAPQVVDDAVAHGQHDVADLQLDLVDDGIVLGRVGAVGAELARAVEPVPLLRRLEDDGLVAGAHHHDLAVAEVGDVQERHRGAARRAGWCFKVQLRAARRGGPLPVVRFRRFECFLVGCGE